MTDRLFNGKGPQPTGGLDLTGHLHKARMREIVDAAFAQRGKPPTIAYPIDLTVQGNPREMPVGAVRAAFDSAYWDCVARVRLLGMRVEDGDFSVVDGPMMEVGPGQFRCVLYVQWQPRKAALEVTP